MYFRNFYYTLISQTADEVLFGAEGLPEDAEKIAAVTFSYTGEDRPEDVLGYYRISDRKLYVTRNREDTAFTMSLTKWEQVWDTLEKLTAGEEVEARY